MKRVLITGANGFVGRHVCQEFVTAGWRVVAGMRRLAAAEELPRGVQPAFLDFDDDTDLEPLLEGIDVVVHLVARTHVLNDRVANALEVYRQANVSPTRRLARACGRQGVSRFVYMSSIQVVGDGEATAYSETTPCFPQHHYGISKLEAERVLFAEVSGTDLEPVVIRPPLVYGPHVLANFLRLIRLARLGLPLPLASVRNARSLIFVKNLADAVRTAAEHPAAAGHVFHVADAEPISTPGMVAKLAELQGCRRLQFPVPAGLLRLAGRLINRQAEVSRLVGSLTVSTEKIRRQLQWSPPYDLDEGFRQTVRWFEETKQQAKASANDELPVRSARKSGKAA